MRRGDKEITDRLEIDRILDEALVARVGMVDNGQPYVVPLNFAREKDTLWLHCATHGRKLECLQANPEVCVEVDRLIEITRGESACRDWTSCYESVIGFGACEIVGDSVTKLQGLRAIMRKYSGREDWGFSAERLEKTTVLRVRLRLLTGKRSPATD